MLIERASDRNAHTTGQENKVNDTSSVQIKIEAGTESQSTNTNESGNTDKNVYMDLIQFYNIVSNIFIFL